VKLAHPVAEVLQQPVAQAHHLAQFVEAFLGHLAGRRMFLSREARDAERIDRIGLGAFQFFLGEASSTHRVDQRHRETLGHQIRKQIAPVVSRCFHGDQTALRRAEQLPAADTRAASSPNGEVLIITAPCSSNTATT
jgi:hypothetical protein